MYTMWPLGLWILLCLNLVAADDLSMFQNNRGATPCTIARFLQSSCDPTDSAVPDGNIFTIPPVSASNCTCNAVFYNLWSACCMYTSTPRPSFEAWSSQCADQFFEVTYNDYPQHKDAKFIDIPHWAYQGIATFSTLDLDQAVKRETEWNATTIVTPIAVGVSLISVFGILFVLYKWHWKKRQSQKNEPQPWRQDSLQGPRRLFGLVPDVFKVQHRKKTKNWAIDDFADFQSPEPHRSGHIRLGSDILTRHTIPKSVQKHWRWPWNRNPIVVRSAPPKRGFSIDGLDGIAGSRRSTPDIIHVGAETSSGTGLRNGSQEDGRRQEHPGEGPDEQSAFLISQSPGQDFGIASRAVETQLSRSSTPPPMYPAAYPTTHPTTHLAMQPTTHHPRQPPVQTPRHPPTNPATHPQIQSQIYPPTNHSTPPPIQSQIHPPTNPVTHPPIQSQIRPPTNPATHPPISMHPPTKPPPRPPIQTVAQPPTHSSPTHSSMHSATHSLEEDSMSMMIISPSISSPQTALPSSPEVLSHTSPLRIRSRMADAPAILSRRDSQQSFTDSSINSDSPLLLRRQSMGSLPSLSAAQSSSTETPPLSTRNSQASFNESFVYFSPHSYSTDSLPLSQAHTQSTGSGTPVDLSPSNVSFNHIIPSSFEGLSRLRPSKSHTTNLFPPAVRAAGYSGVPRLYDHGNRSSSETLYQYSTRRPAMAS